VERYMYAGYVKSLGCSVRVHRTQKKKKKKKKKNKNKKKKKKN
jgi:hypothetical protein